MSSGKGKTQANPNGMRRVESTTGKLLAPKSLRDRRKYESECKDEELKRAQVKRQEKS